MTGKPPARKPPAPPARKPPASATAKTAAAPSKKFKVAAWDTEKEGQRIIGYGDSGMGKTTLAAMLPNPKFIDFRGGSDKILHPVTGKRLQHIPGVETFDDVRSVCGQTDILQSGDSLVIDTGTEFENRGMDWTFANVPHEKGNRTITRVEDYGYGKGYRHIYDTMKLPLADFDNLICRGVNVVILCQMQQVEIAHSGGADFLCDVPKLQKAHGKSTPAVWEFWHEWADHTLKIGLNDISIDEGKAASTGTHAIFVHGQVHFKAKSRTIPSEYPVVSFEHKADSSIWEMIFNEAWKELE